jgi:hypothetical protein
MTYHQPVCIFIRGLNHRVTKHHADSDFSGQLSFVACIRYKGHVEGVFGC